MWEQEARRMWREWAAPAWVRYRGRVWYRRYIWKDGTQGLVDQTDTSKGYTVPKYEDVRLCQGDELEACIAIWGK